MDTSSAMRSHVLDVLCLGSLLYQTRHIESRAHMQGLAARDMSLIFMQAPVLLHFSPRERLQHCFREQLFLLGSLLSNEVARDTSPMKVGAGAGIAKGCRVGTGLWL